MPPEDFSPDEEWNWTPERFYRYVGRMLGHEHAYQEPYQGKLKKRWGRRRAEGDHQ